MSVWRHRICERCWFDGPGVTDDGAYRRPTQVIDADPGACCFCAGFTITGIYVRRDPNGLCCQGEHDDLSWSRVGVLPKPDE